MHVNFLNYSFKEMY